MDGVPLFGDEKCRIVRGPRSYLCLPFPDDFLPPKEDKRLALLAERMGDCLGVEVVTPRLLALGKDLWMIVFFYGREALHRAATYENVDGQMGSVVYRPRQAAVVVADVGNRLLYISSMQRSVGVKYLLPALSGTVFPNCPTVMPYRSFRFDLNVLPGLRACDRRPVEGEGVWRSLTLKSITTCEPGRDVLSQKMNWSRDGFEYLDQQAFLWPRHLYEVGLQFQPLGGKRAFSVSFCQNEGVLRATLTSKTLPTLARLVQLCSANGDDLKWVGM